MNNRIFFGAVLIVFLVFGILASLYVSPVGQSSAVGDTTRFLDTYSTPRELPSFELLTHHGESFTNNELLEHWSLVFLGFTNCPDICPMTLAKLGKIYPQLQQLEGNAPIQVIFLAIDPQRDTQERLQTYMSYFQSGLLAVTGDHSELFPMVRSLGMMYAIPGDTSDPYYAVDHSASVVVINPEGKAIGRFKPVPSADGPNLSNMDHILADMPAIIDGSY